MTTLTITGIPPGAQIGALVRDLADIAAQHGLRISASVRNGGQVFELVPEYRPVAAPERACSVDAQAFEAMVKKGRKAWADVAQRDRMGREAAGQRA